MTVATVAARPVTPPLRIADGTLEALKWLALVLMTLDHVNKYLYRDTLTLAFEAGRLAMPIFAFVLSYNLARPGAQMSGTHARTATRLAICGALASLPYIALGRPVAGVLWGWWPLNIMFTLLVATVLLWVLEQDNASWTAVVALFVVGGAFVEFCWPALAFCVASWAYAKKPDLVRLVAWTACAASLWIINRNLWALGAVPLILLATRLDLALPRFSVGFYAYYPAHLAVLWAALHIESHRT